MRWSRERAASEIDRARRMAAGSVRLCSELTHDRHALALFGQPARPNLGVARTGNLPR